MKLTIDIQIDVEAIDGLPQGQVQQALIATFREVGRDKLLNDGMARVLAQSTTVQPTPEPTIEYPDFS